MDPSVRRRSLNELLDRTTDTNSVASAISVEEYEEIVRSEIRPGQSATSYTTTNQQFGDNSVSSPTSEQRAPVVHLAYTGRPPADTCRSMSYNDRSTSDTERTTPYNGRTTSDTELTISYFYRTPADVECAISDNHPIIINMGESTLPATQDVAQRHELLVAQPGSIAGKTQSMPTIVESGLPLQYSTTQHQPGNLPSSLSLSAGETDSATLQIPIAPRGDRRSNKRPFNDTIGCTVDSATLNLVDFSSGQVGLHCQSSQSVLNLASLSATTSYSTAGQCNTSVIDSYEPL